MLSGGASEFRVQPTLGVDGFNGWLNGNRMTGPFHNNGDYTDMPTTATGALNYYDASGALIWSRVPTSINAACDHWCGFCVAAGVIYAVAVDTAASPATYYIGYINVSGTVTISGGAMTPTTDFTVVPAWQALGVSLSNGWEGDGFFHLTSAGEHMEIWAGTIANDPADIQDHSGGHTPIHYCGSGIFVQSFFMNTDGDMYAYLTDTEGRSALPGVGPASGLAGQYNAHVVPVQWGGYVGILAFNASEMLYGARFFEAAEFNSKMILLAQRNGLGG